MEEIFISPIRLLIVLFFLVCLSTKQLLAIGSNKKDYESLVAFKNQFLKQSNGDQSIIMSSWNDTNHYCSWEGVTCGRKHDDRVVALDLSSGGLVGSLPPFITNLTFLQRLDLSSNNLYGEIPPNLSSLHRLIYLNLSFNSLQGDIPCNLMMNHSSILQVLDLSSNKLMGKIPDVITSLPSLNLLNLCKNNLIGTVPPSIGNLTFLENLYVCYNHLEGGIPLEIGGLHELKELNVADNNLSGNIPHSFYNLSSLRRVSVTNNHLSGYISTNIAQAFPNLEIFYFAENNFVGSLDQALHNVTSLVHLDVSRNNFTGVVPPELGKIYNLKHLNMAHNQLEAGDWRFLDSLTNCTSLQILGFHGNNLQGMLPKSFGNLSIELQEITLGFNHISGSIHSELDRYTNLIGLGMEGNLLEGPIPESIEKLGRLQILGLDGNRLTGTIPYSLPNLTRLTALGLSFNHLTGPIPSSSFKNLQFLTALDLSHNNFIGLIPRELFLIHTLSNYLDLSHNSFTGTLPAEVGLLVNLMLLDISNNNLTGEIPKSLASCPLLSELYLKYNFFHGSIPASLGNMKGLEILDLSHNNLSGPIPQSLQNITLLKQLNLSFNNLEGEVPTKGVFANSSAISLLGNENICGGISGLHLPKCIAKSSSKRRRMHHLIKTLVPILGMLAMMFIISFCYTFLCGKQKQSRRRKNSPDSSLSTPFPRISYAKLLKATHGFSPSYLIGSGRYGTVYRGTLRDYQTDVAIKVFNLEVHGAFKSFTSECDALRSIRHRNLVKVLTSCSSIDLKGQDFKALIFDFMPNQNLDIWLHREDEAHGDHTLSLERRLNIIIDIADALEYLHHSCEPSIIHCDIKPCNILLDDNMTAHIGDFGLSRIFSEAMMSMSAQISSNKSEIKGTIGYIAPEYGEGARPSTSADVYSFGVMLLEMITGRRPTDDIFENNLNMYNHVKMTFSRGINSIIDHKMFTKEQRDDDYSNCQHINECLFSLAEVGLSCSTSLPDKRPHMRDVAKKLHTIKASYLQQD